MTRVLQRSTAAPNTLDLASAIAGTPQGDFHSDRYLRNTARRLEHLASLGLKLENQSVLEVGAGIGDLTTFFLDRGCRVHSTEGRPDNFEVLRQRYEHESSVTTELLDLDPPPSAGPGTAYDVVFAYGVLYHVSRPDLALDYLAEATRGVLLLETIVKPGGTPGPNMWAEDAELAGAAVSGMGSRPTRSWVWEQLKQRFAYVAVPVTQPRHAEFPIDWTLESHPAATRSIFVASRTALASDQLSTVLLDRQRRH
ncbi:MAG TPA: class I SAM-dependent methyltransferase [Phycisphaerales bacterium]